MPTTRPCDHCGTSYTRPPSLAGRYCSPTCAYAARRKAQTTQRRMRYLPSHPLAPASGLVSEARVVLYDRLGPGPHPCHWCEKPADWLVGQRGQPSDALVADHVDSDPLNDDPANLVASCGTCNVGRAKWVPDDETYITRPNGGRLRAVARACEHCGASFLAVPAQVAVGKGRFCSRSCARRKV